MHQLYVGARQSTLKSVSIKKCLAVHEQPLCFKAYSLLTAHNSLCEKQNVVPFACLKVARENDAAGVSAAVACWEEFRTNILWPMRVGQAFWDVVLTLRAEGPGSHLFVLVQGDQGS